MMSQLTDPLSAGPALLENKISGTQDEIRKPATTKIYQAPPSEEKPKGAGYANHILNTSVPQEVIDSLGGIEDTIKPLKLSLKEHELRPYEFQKDYKKSAAEIRELNLLHSQKLLNQPPFDQVLKKEPE